MADNVLEITELSVAFPTRDGGWRGSEVTVVDRISLTIAPGEIVGLVGESGSGKSTTARGILRLIPSSGRIVLHGVDISTMGDRQLRPHRRHAQMVFQDPYSSLDPAMTVAALLGEAMQLDGVKRSRREARERATELLEQVGLGAVHLDRYPAEFSGGQRQRVAIARALASKPSLIICDEAVSALDVSTQRQIVRLLRTLRAETGRRHPVHRPRPRRGAPDRRPHDRDVLRPARRGGPLRRAVPPARPPVHAGPAVGRPGPGARPPARAAPRDPVRRRAEPGRAPVGLPVPRAMPVRDGRVPLDGAGDDRDGGRHGSLPPPPTRRPAAVVRRRRGDHQRRRGVDRGGRDRNRCTNTTAPRSAQ